MTYAVELCFDRRTENAIKRLYNSLKRQRINSTMSDEKVRPHITLALFDCHRADELKSALGNFATKTRRFSLRLGHIGLFSKTGVVFLAPIVTPELLTAHHTCLGALRQLVRNVWPYYEEGKLVFHCTMGLGMKRADSLRAVQLMMRSKLPGSFHVREVALVHIPGQNKPMRTVYETRLSQ